MKILVLEYVTGGGMRREPIPPALAREGGQMLRALADDLLALAGVELLVLCDDRLALPSTEDRIETVYIGGGADFRTVWLESIGRCDAIWPIAPETGGILEGLCRDVETAGRPLLTCPSAAVRLAASKLQTANRLAAHGLPVAPTVPLETWRAETNRAVVIKPDDGVGCDRIQIVRDPAAFVFPADTDNWIVQPLLEAAALSLSALFSAGRARLLSCNRQVMVETADGFALTACQVNAVADADGSWQHLADGIARALPELWGYAGVDLVLTTAGPCILEINPRLTTSYAGLREATGLNPAALTLALLATGELPPPRARNGKTVTIRLE